MLDYLQTTVLILLWCLALSVTWAVLQYASMRRQYVKKTVSTLSAPAIGGTLIVPTLIAGPLLIIFAYRIFHLNLLFPVQLLSSQAEVVVAAIVPAIVLIIASGLAYSLRLQIRREYVYWRQQPCATAALAYGKSIDHEIRLLVILKALASGWSQSLPWLFGEIVIVEVVFNAPGLGLSAWHFARLRDFSSLSSLVIWLAALYLICNALSLGLNRWVGKRLEGYL